MKDGIVIATPKGFGLLFVMVAPAGAGKNTLMNEVMARVDGLSQLATATTRPMRAGEQQGREHFFVSPDEFQRMIDDGDLLEYQVVHANLYGVLRVPVEQMIAAEQDKMADIDIKGAAALRAAYPDNTVLIFIQPPSRDALIERMHKRGESDDEIEKRLERVDMELNYAPECDYLILNDDVEHAADVLKAIIIAERSHRAVLKLRAQVQKALMHEAR